jgi:predicted PurR-regulated permease PerM
VTRPAEGDPSVAAPGEPAHTDDGDRVAFDPTGRPPSGDLARTARRFLLIVGIAIGLVGLWLLRDLLIVLLLAILVASGMYGVVAPLERRLPRLTAIGVAYLALLLALAGLGLLIAPPLVDEAATLIENLPELVDELQAEVSDIIDSVAGAGAGAQLFDRFLPQMVEDQADERIVALPFTVIQVLANLAIMLFLSAMILSGTRSFAGPPASSWRATGGRR